MEARSAVIMLDNLRPHQAKKVRRLIVSIEQENERFEQLHSRYQELKPVLGWEEAREAVAREFHTSERTVRRVLHGS